MFRTIYYYSLAALCTIYYYSLALLCTASAQKVLLCINFSSDYTVSVVNSEIFMWEILFQYALSLEQGDNNLEMKDNSCSS